MQDYNERFQALIFDFGGVLIDWDPRYLYRKIFNGDDQAIEQFLHEVDFFEWNQKQDAGRSFHQAVEEACRRYPSRCELIRAYDERYAESISGPIWPTVEILGELKQAGYSLYGLSNWPAEKWREISPKFEFFSWFDDIVISGEVKLAKPDPAIFHLLLDCIGRPAGECLYIDDSAHNIETADHLGFHTVHFKSPEKLRAVLEELEVLAPQGSLPGH